MTKDKRWTIGIDFGGTQVRAALLCDHQIMRRVALRTDVPGGPRAIMDQFAKLVDDVCTADERAHVDCVGLCSPGPVDTATGVTLDLPTIPGWKDFPLLQSLHDRLSLPVIVENDAIAAAYGEWVFGAGKGLRHLIYITVSTGIGGGAIVDGQLLHGRRGMATHFGHLQLQPDGPRCGCGGIGCFESLASGSALGEKARRVKTGHLAGKAHATAKDVVDGARLGDTACKDLITEEARLLGRGIASLLALFSPERVVMGGGVSQAFDLLDGEMHDMIKRHAMPVFRDVRIVPAQLADNAGLLGAAALARLKLDQKKTRRSD
jgi:glucokinase